MQTLDKHAVIYDETAQKTIDDMLRQAQCVREAWHRHQPEWVIETNTSLAAQLGRLASASFGAESSVYRDGELSLFVRTPSIVFGVIFHPKHRPQEDEYLIVGATRAPRMGVYCMAQVDGGGYCCRPYTQKARDCECVTPLPVLMPLPGEWSFHS